MSDTPPPKGSEPDPTEPIDVEFEPAEEAAPIAATKDEPGVGMPSLIVASVAAAIAGGAIGVVASGNSGMDTAKFAPAEVKDEIAGLADIQRDLNERLQSMRGDLSELTARSLGESERVAAALEARSDGEDVLRSELESLTAQLAVIIGDPASNAGNGANASPSPLAELVSRIETLENRLAAEAGAPDTPQRLQRALRAVEERLDVVETADASLQAALENRAEALAALQAGLFSANETVAELQQRLSALETAPGVRAAETSDADVAALNAQIADLSAQIDALAEAPRGQDSVETAPSTPASAAADPAAQAALALSAVEIASRRGKPFASAHARLEQALPDDEDVAAIAPIAMRGAPSLVELGDAFQELKPALTVAAEAAAEDDGWGWLRNAMSGVVTVRSTDGEAGDLNATLDSISDAVASGDLTEALDVARALDGAAALELKDWIASAERRAELETRMDRLRRKLLDATTAEEG